MARRNPPRSHAEMMKEVDALPVPPKSPAVQAAEVSLTLQLRQAADDLRAQNLSVAVSLAQQAAAGRGQMIDVFSEIGRRYGHLLNQPAKKAGRSFNVIEGGQA